MNTYRKTQKVKVIINDKDKECKDKLSMFNCIDNEIDGKEIKKDKSKSKYQLILIIEIYNFIIVKNKNKSSDLNPTKQTNLINLDYENNLQNYPSLFTANKILYENQYKNNIYNSNNICNMANTQNTSNSCNQNTQYNLTNFKNKNITSYKFDYFKREDINKNVLRRFKKFVRKFFVNNNCSKFIQIANIGILKHFIKLNILPPMSFKLGSDVIEFKSFNSSYIYWLFSHPGIKEVFSLFLSEKIDDFLNTRMGEQPVNIT